MNNNGLDLIHCEMDNSTLVKRSEIRNFQNGTQLVVYESQEAIFFKEGRALDSFGAGRYTLETDNLPATKKLFGHQFNNVSTPFFCDVYFVNLVSVLTLLWGTPTPITMEDPKYEILINVKASGQTGLRVKNARQFVIKVVGQLEEFSVDNVCRSVKTSLLTSLASTIAETITYKKVSILEIAAHLDELSLLVRDRLNEKLDDLGLEVEQLNIGTIFCSDEDLARLRKAKEDAMERKILGTGTPSAAPAPAAPAASADASVGGAVCPACKAPLPQGAKFCATCGTAVPTKKFCTNCGTQLSSADRFCSTCGQKQF